MADSFSHLGDLQRVFSEQALKLTGNESLSKLTPELIAALAESKSAPKSTNSPTSLDSASATGSSCVPAMAAPYAAEQSANLISASGNLSSTATLTVSSATSGCTLSITATSSLGNSISMSAANSGSTLSITGSSINDDAGKNAGLDIGLNTGLNTSLDAGLNTSSDTGSIPGLNTGSNTSLESGLSTSLDAGADVGSDTGASLISSLDTQVKAQAADSGGDQSATLDLAMTPDSKLTLSQVSDYPSNVEPTAVIASADATKVSGGSQSQVQAQALAQPLAQTQTLSQIEGQADTLPQAQVQPQPQAQVKSQTMGASSISSNAAPVAADSDLQVSLQQAQQGLVDLAIEAWRFLNVFERVLSKLEPKEQTRYHNQKQWFVRKLHSSLQLGGLRLVDVTGQVYEPGMAVTPINLDDFEPEQTLLVERMLEPIIMHDDAILKMGTVNLCAQVSADDKANSQADVQTQVQAETKVEIKSEQVSGAGAGSAVGAGLDPSVSVLNSSVAEVCPNPNFNPNPGLGAVQEAAQDAGQQPEQDSIQVVEQVAIKAVDTAGNTGNAAQPVESVEPVGYVELGVGQAELAKMQAGVAVNAKAGVVAGAGAGNGLGVGAQGAGDAK